MTFYWSIICGFGEMYNDMYSLYNIKMSYPKFPIFCLFMSPSFQISSNLWSLCIVFPFLENHLVGITEHVAFQIFFSLNMYVRFHYIFSILVPYFRIVLNNICTTHFFHSSDQVSNRNSLRKEMFT